ncbi:putative E3 ubiquitin-protein ligase LIN-1 isoform X1 [Nicotiana tabacum]|uniref:E3 ubiquitin-protein ligase LIN-1 isoform X1 n=2 Tax=Nicotiana tabacum TaxID=4097 RepID=A0AC58T8T7_TOBAC|nr:PREDICTED: putative E3 ubiquitin-protein ligase LIN-2 isoform X1 [Nicotiana tabacum]
MSMSLEDLLAKEGFNKRMSKTVPRASSGTKARREPIYTLQEPHKLVSSSGGMTKSAIPWHDLKDKTPRVNFADRRQKKESKHRMGSCDLSSDVKRISISSFDELLAADASQSNEIVEIGERNGSRYNHIYSNQTYRNRSGEGRSSSRSEEAEGKRQSFGKDTKATTKCLNNSGKLLSDYQKHIEQPETSYSRSTRSSLTNKSYDAIRSLKKAEIEHTAVIPALDEVAVQAVISILSGYIKRFLVDEDFRTSLRHNSFASLNFVGLEEGLNTESKVLATLEQAIETVERAAEDCANEKELKKASLQLSVITGLNSNNLRDGFTSGIPNFKLAACAHLYLSVIYKIQKKDRIAAKHILQVFCDSPFQARTNLLPDLWDHIFFHHLSNLKAWFDSEANFLGGLHNKSTKLKFLEKMYNENLDKGTYKFALYYKEWLTEGADIPLLPSIEIPSVSVQYEGSFSNTSHLSSTVGSFSPQPVVSKKLYDEVFCHSHKLENESEEHREESYEVSVRRPSSFAAENLVALKYSAEVIKRIDHDVEPGAIVDSYGASTGDAEGVSGVNSPEEKNLMETFGNSDLKETTPLKSNMPESFAPANLTEFIFNRIAKAAFERKETEDSIIDAAPPLLLFSEVALALDCTPTEALLPAQGVDYEDYVGRSSANIPQEFICPLTGLLFEDPVTLETGQTFDRASITSWFSKGNRTCPVTRRLLECQSVPRTNFTLKRVITNWKSEHWRRLLTYFSKAAGDSGKHRWLKNEIVVSVLQQLLIVLNQDERRETLEQLISLGSLQFLIQRFNCGKLREKIRVSGILCSCIEADNNCRNVVAGNVDKMCLLNLLRNEELELRRNAFSLLTELICLNRRKDAKFFIKGIHKDNIVKTMNDLLMYLQDCPCEQRSMVAVLLLHFDLLADTKMPNTYRDDAVDAMTMALESSLSDERSREICCKALLILGGHFSFSGKIMTEDWILKQAGFLEGFDVEYPDDEENKLVDATVMTMEDEEEEARKKWLVNASALLIGSGKKSFVEALSKCLGSGNSELVRICLTTVAWLSSALASLTDSEFELSAFLAIISQLIECLQHGDLVEHKVLASMSLLNFSKILECRVLLMMIAEDIAGPLESLVEITWAAKELYAIIFCS